ncbi:MAG: hypothetical protein AB7N91_02830 [Candidatus Tectimicrobiota bacterium]
MFERLADFWDIVVFGFVLLMLASLQLRHATAVEVVLSLAAIVCAVGLLLAKKWALLGLYLVLTASYPVYFGQIWLQSITAGSGAYIVSNLLKMLLATLLFVYIGRERMERRLS